MRTAPRQVFLSYASSNREIADEICALLESEGLPCWMAPRDISPGISYGQAIVGAIRQARVMVLVFSAQANASSHVLREVERAASQRIPIVPVRVEDVLPSESLEYFLSTPHWLDAIGPDRASALRGLADAVRYLLQPVTQLMTAPPVTTPPVAASPIAASPIAVSKPRPDPSVRPGPPARSQPPPAAPPGQPARPRRASSPQTLLGQPAGGPKDIGGGVRGGPGPRGGPGGWAGRHALLSRPLLLLIAAAVLILALAVVWALARSDEGAGAAGPKVVVEIHVTNGQALVYRQGKRLGTTPLTLRETAGSTLQLELRRPGCTTMPVTFEVPRTPYAPTYTLRCSGSRP